MTLGLFEKIVLADTMLSGSADRIFGYAGPLVAARFLAGRDGIRRPDIF